MLYLMVKAGRATTPGMRTVVVSRTLRPADHPDVTIVSDRLEETVTGLRREPGKDIWLFGGGLPFRSLLEAEQATLRLGGPRVYGSGIVLLEYAVAQ